MVTTRSKSVKKIDKKKVWDTLRTTDKVMEVAKKNLNKEVDPSTIGEVEQALVLMAIPLDQKARKQLIDNVEYAC